MKVVDADLRDQPLSGPRGPALAIGVLTTGHFFTDFYAQLFPPLLVLFQVRFDLSVREAALVAHGDRDAGVVVRIGFGVQQVDAAEPEMGQWVSPARIIDDIGKGVGLAVALPPG